MAKAKLSERKFYRTVIQVEVLSEEPYEFNGLEQLAQDVTSGDCSGKDTTIIDNQSVTAPEMAKMLRAQGSDPGFLGLDDEGMEAER